ncbi:MAG: plasmid pRiA4b ORF-3 family protein [Chloroflexota bacterium]|nr:plasmid pRiA4b ORF-3 family protein [Chloroflexota bacterium]
MYQLKVTLKEIKPPVWRRIEVPGNIDLGVLHAIVQAVMGWDDGHLHQFIVGGDYYSDPSPDWGLGDEVLSERRTTLKQIAAEPGVHFAYEYDLGDSWMHEILIEKILPPEKGAHYPRCIKGKRACPPEDIGGAWGYEEFLVAIADPNHPQHAEMLEWVGGSFDPEEFDLEEADKSLMPFRK